LWERLKLRKTNADREKSLGDVQARDALLLIRQELADVEFELNRRQSDRSNQEQSIQERLSDVRLELTQLAEQSPAVTSTVAGRVDVVLARPGDVLSAGAAVAQVIPEGAAWTAALLVPKTVSQALSVGAEVPLLIESGAGHVSRARVTRIGDSNVTREEASAFLTTPLVEPMVRVDLEVLDSTDPGLRAGARVRVDVPGGTRSLWQHFWSRR
jgi:multidrug efflux pump subunit AcrA (membrane-fusion protein)